MNECRHPRKQEIRADFGEHGGKNICIDCLAFLGWTARDEERQTPSDTMAHIRHLLSGPLFEPNTYTDKSGIERTWDDRTFFTQMLRNDGQWSPAQDALLRKRFNHYAKHGHKLQGQAAHEKASKLDIPERLGNEPLGDIPF